MDHIVLTAYKISDKTYGYNTSKVVRIPKADIQEIVPIPSTSASTRYKAGTTKVVTSTKEYGVYETMEQIDVADDPTTTNTQALDIALTVSAAGSDQAGGTALTKYFNKVTTCVASTADGVVLPSAVANKVVVVLNGTAAAGAVWPASSDSIDSSAENSDVALAAGDRKHFVAASATQWYTAAE